jgi:hypothetical protein
MVAHPVLAEKRRQPFETGGVPRVAIVKEAQTA